MIKKQVKDLQAGDNLGSCTIIANPVNIGDYCGQKNRMQVSVRYSNGKESSRIWGRYTTVSVCEPTSIKKEYKNFRFDGWV